MHPHGPVPAGLDSGSDRVSVSVSWPSRLTVPVLALCAYLRDRTKTRVVKKAVKKRAKKKPGKK
jgi:esterase/lipase superfamily enzyme